MKKMLLLTVAVMLAGCASSGTNFKGENIGHLQPGITTVQEAQALFGAPPVQTTVTPDGGSIVWWRHINSNGFTGRTTIKQMGLAFSTDGRFQRITDVQNVPISEADRRRLFAAPTR